MSLEEAILDRVRHLPPAKQEVLANMCHFWHDED